MDERDFLAATRASYETVAAAYADATREGLVDRPYDRALLSLFADLVRANGGGRVADIGCGAGHVVAHLRHLGLDAFGVDLSPAMLAEARRAHPDLEFRPGSILKPAVPDRSLGGIVAQYSFNTVPARKLPAAFAQLRRALVPGGLLFLAFAVREEATELTTWFDLPVTLPLQRLVPDDVEAALRDAGLRPRARTVREPRPDEASAHAYVLAARPG